MRRAVPRDKEFGLWRSWKRGVVRFARGQVDPERAAGDGLDTPPVPAESLAI